MDVDLCARCGAPLTAANTAATTGATKTCRFCGAEGRTRVALGPAEPPPHSSQRPAVCVAGETIETLFERYVADLRARVKKPGPDHVMDERLLHAVEDRMEIPDKRRDEYRREAVSLIDALAAAGRTFEPGTNRRIDEALEAILAEDAPR